MDEYVISLMPKAGRDLEEIYHYIADNLKEEGTAENMINLLENAILGLNILPSRGAERKTGSFAQKGYRQIFVKNFTIIYRIIEREKKVVIVAVKYAPSNF